MTAFSKIFVGTVAFTFVSLGIASYASKRAYETDPELLQKISTQAQKRGFQFHVGSFDSRPAATAYERTEGTWSFKTPQELSIVTVNGDVTIEGISGDEIHVEAAGELDRSQANQLVETVFEGNMLVLKEPEHEAVKDLAMKIQIPTSFKGHLKIVTVGGDLVVERVESKKLSIVTVSGDVLAKDITSPEVSVGSVSGEVRVENRIAANISAASVSGDIMVRLIDGEKSTIDVTTVSGDAQSRYPMGQKGQHTVKVHSTSGDIVIE
jgi:Uncharacterized conserved protein